MKNEFNPTVLTDCHCGHVKGAHDDQRCYAAGCECKEFRPYVVSFACGPCVGTENLEFRVNGKLKIGAKYCDWCGEPAGWIILPTARPGPLEAEIIINSGNEVKLGSPHPTDIGGPNAFIFYGQKVLVEVIALDREGYSWMAGREVHCGTGILYRLKGMNIVLCEHQAEMNPLQKTLKRKIRT